MAQGPRVPGPPDNTNPKRGAKDVSGPLSLKDISTILEMLDKHNVTEFSLNRGDEKISLRRGREVKKKSAQAPQARPTLVTVAPQTSNVVPFVHAAPVVNVSDQRTASPSRENQSSNLTGNTAPLGVADSVAPRKALKEITSPMVGTFYRRPAVDAEPYVDVGDSVKRGDVLCIVEAMKLMNEIEADIGGRIVEVCLEDGQMVEFGEVLFRVEQI